MNVLITGGTGFLGSHVCRQMMSAGHSVRLLVRDLSNAEELYVRFAEGTPQLSVGDVTDAASVRSALVDCEAVVHAAAGTPMQFDTLEKLFAVNVDGVKHVVGSALELGIDRIVCVSSITAVFNEDGRKVTPDAPPTPSTLPYGQSKVEAENYLRDLQAKGAPIAIVYPGGIIGPDDPGLSDSCAATKYRIENGFRIIDDGGMQLIDVRDLAELIRSLIEEGGQGRFLVPGVYSTWTEQADIIEEVAGCTLQRIAAKGWQLRLVGRLMDIARRFKTIDSPISAETMRYATLWPKIENTDELKRRGIDLRDQHDTFDATLRWMVAAGHLDPSLCPKYQTNSDIAIVAQ